MNKKKKQGGVGLPAKFVRLDMCVGFFFIQIYITHNGAGLVELSSRGDKKGKLSTPSCFFFPQNKCPCFLRLL